MVLRQHRAFPRVEAEARHTGIEMKKRRQRAVEPACEARPCVDLRQRAKRGNDAVRGEVLFRAGEQAAQYDQRGVRNDVAQRQRLIRGGDEEMPASGRRQRRRDRTRAKAVAVGL